MIEKKSVLILICFWVMLVLSGCDRSGEILYFDRETESGVSVPEDVAELSGDGSADEEPDGTADMDRQICVHVCGQVCRPGVVMLPEGSRAWEAVEAAGGFSEDAGDAAVNLAAVLRDGERLYIPSSEEAISEPVSAADDGKIDLNTADENQLQTLPEIGESRAAEILSYREKNGGFQSVEEIMRVPGIKESIYEKIRNRIRVD